MRLVRIGLALVTVLALAAPVAAQQVDDRVSINAAIGPSFANVGTTFSTIAGLNVKLADRAAIVGEFGLLPHAPFRDAAEIAPPAPPTGDSPRVYAYHWNANVKVRPFEIGRFEPYVTGGLGSFTADTVVKTATVGTARFEDRRRATNLATNIGAGAGYWFNDWVGVGVDYRTFFVHRDGDTPRVHRLTAGLMLALQ